MKNIRIKIKTDGGVYVSASTAVPLCKIEAFLLEKADWIIKNTENAQRKLDFVRPRLESGVRLYILGEALTLEVRCGLEEAVEKQGQLLFITANEPENEAHTEQLLLGYIAEKGRDALSADFDFFLAKSGYKGEKPRLSLKMLKSKWGHCDHRKNEIMLNFALCCLPPVLAAYVAAHEVAHLLIPNHSPQFYRTGELLMPGFRLYNKEIRSFSTSLWNNIFIK